MKTKILEIRDEGTMIPVLCVDMNPDPAAVCAEPDQAEQSQSKHHAQRYLLRRCGYPCDGRPNIAMTHLRCGLDPCTNDPYHWGGRTYPVAHHYIIKNWGTLKDGDIVDVQFILGETKAPKVSERLTAEA